MTPSQFARYPTGNLCNADSRVRPLCSSIKPLIVGRRIAGPARTVRITPGQNGAIHRAVHHAQSSEVLVVDGGASDRYGPFGDLLADGCMAKSIAGAVFNCTIRDSADISRLGFQVFCRGFHPEATAKTEKGETDITLRIGGVDIRPGNIIEYEKGIWKVAKIQHTQPGKGGAYMQVEMKNLQDGRKTNVRFRSADTVEKVRLDTADYQFLYEDGDMLVFMDTVNYEQINLPNDLLGDARPFLQDGMQVMLELWEEKPISVQLPQQVEAEITEADAVVKGQTASSSYKPAVLDNGVRIMVPPHIESGTRIIVDVYEQTYVGKA